MSETLYCSTHKERISSSACSSCGKRLCVECFSRAFGKDYCVSCETIERTKQRRRYFDPLVFFEKREDKAIISRLRHCLLLPAVLCVVGSAVLFVHASGIMPVIHAEKLADLLPKNILIALSKNGNFAANAAGKTVSVEMISLSRFVEMEHAESGSYPSDLAAFLRKNCESGNSKKDQSEDIWGMQYRLEPTANGFVLRSAGADKQYFNDDDILVTLDRESGTITSNQ